jgi:hypothetical protein
VRLGGVHVAVVELGDAALTDQFAKAEQGARAA